MGLDKFTNKMYQQSISTQTEFKNIDKNLFWGIFKSKAELLLKSGYIISKENKNVLECLFRYFCHSEDFNDNGIIKNNASLDKGLYIHGSYGVGKTKFFEILKEVGKELYRQGVTKQLLFRQASGGSFVQIFMASQKRGIDFDINQYYKNRLYIDDLGIEQLCFNSYELLGDVLFERYRNNAKTWITTNLTPTEYGNKYGGRLADRFNEMFNIIEWNGASFRDKM